jgi:hypothetical protein
MDTVAVMAVALVALGLIVCIRYSCADDSNSTQEPEVKLVSVPGSNMPIVAQPPPIGYQVQPSAPMAPLPSTSITLQVAPPVDLLANHDTRNASHQQLPSQYPTDTVVAIPSPCDLTEQLQLTRHPRPNVATVVNDDD